MAAAGAFLGPVVGAVGEAVAGGAGALLGAAANAVRSAAAVGDAATDAATMARNALSSGIYHMPAPSSSSVGAAAQRIAITSKSVTTQAAEASPKGNQAYLDDGAAEPALASGPKTSYYSYIDKNLWGSKGPNIADFQQGAVGNCWFSSVLQNLTLRDPDIVKNMIVPIDEKGNYAVKLYDPASNPITVTVDSSLPGDDAGNLTQLGKNAEGIGGALIEKAAAKYMDFMGDNSSSGFDTLQGGNASQASNMLLPAANRIGNTYTWNQTGYIIYNSAGRPTLPSSATDFSDRLEQALTAGTAKDACQRPVSQHRRLRLYRF